jgi:hypothetical protein
VWLARKPQRTLREGEEMLLAREKKAPSALTKEARGVQNRDLHR